MPRAVSKTNRPACSVGISGVSPPICSGMTVNRLIVSKEARLKHNQNLKAVFEDSVDATQSVGQNAFHPMEPVSDRTE
ncbi:hypothetical protein B2G52_05325 [Neisseria lactamica]|uniref:Uncharacterized protein n=1 Tax=Neisseria lactamica TaxID=486 RepID=A0AAU8VEP7_NEILA|nr:hypothetical protein B2G52_05325 [Neisseria lactamica]